MKLKRSTIAKLILMSAAPVTLVACGEKAPEVKKVVKDERFTTIQDCMAAGKQDQLCAESYLAAIHRHREIAPKYLSQADCESEFTPGGCIATEDGKFVPKMAGFSIVTEQDLPVQPKRAPSTVTQATLSDPETTQAPAQAQAQAQPASTTNVTNVTNSGGGGSGLGDILTGVLIGNALSGGGNSRATNHYYSEPVYQRRDSSGNSSSNTLRGYESSGVKTSKSIQSSVNSRTGSTYDSSSYRSSSSKSYESPAPSRSYSVSSSTSRSGFGSMSSARGGWGG
ncbi:DUF1190 domain-containing protein [Pseudomonas viridiflava]|uniref:DUF1190 domain-containing protein n=1 Tax=Pseudomonas viridiflava TaxID=33069 RepID=UPI0018E5DD6C|nr:DUF1190 domain-containing protein [Pseudomonas viridiflava]MBI6727372.1 DUF1190 domain-containing protein [Pseudomonas viridiflava]